jgi:FkbM family methyltransferase
MKQLKSSVKKVLSSSSLGRSLLRVIRAWRMIHAARAMGAPRGIRVFRRGPMIMIQQGERRLAVNSRHFIYAPDLVADFEALYGAVEPEPSPEGSLVDYSSPRWHRLKRSGRRVFLTSFSEGESVNDVYLRYGEVKRGDVVLDLGANCGLAAMDFASAVGKEGLVISLEPDPSNFNALLKNVEEHGLENVRPLSIGVWSTTGKIWFDADGSMGALAVTEGGQPERGERVEIPVISPIDLAKRFDSFRVDFVKMDIEGSEFEVIPKSGDFLDHFPARWVIEVHDRKRMSELTSVFEGKGYLTQIVSQNAVHNYPLLVAKPIR